MKKFSASLMLLALVMVAFPALGASSVDWNCVKDAMAERDSGVNKAWADYSATVQAAITARTTGMQKALDAAAAAGDDSEGWLAFQTAAKPVAKAYAKAMKTATKNWSKSKRAAKLEYLKTMKQQCKAPSDDAGAAE